MTIKINVLRAKTKRIPNANILSAAIVMMMSLHPQPPGTPERWRVRQVEGKWHLGIIEKTVLMCYALRPYLESYCLKYYLSLLIATLSCGLKCAKV